MSCGRLEISPPIPEGKRTAFPGRVPSVRLKDRRGPAHRVRARVRWRRTSRRSGDLRYAPGVLKITTSSMGWLRTSVGIALIVAPAAPLRLARTDAPTGAALLLMRTIGIRDLVLGLGTVAAARSGGEVDARRWARATLASDSLDTLVALASRRSIGGRDAMSAAGLAFAFVCGDLRAIRTASTIG